MRLRGAGHVAGMWEKRKAHRDLRETYSKEVIWETNTETVHNNKTGFRKMTFENLM